MTNNEDELTDEGTLVYRDRMVAFVKEVLAAYYNVDTSVFTGNKRNGKYIHIRHTAVYFIFKTVPMTKTELAKRFDIDHSTVVYIIKKMDGFLEWDKKLVSEYSKIDNIIRHKTHTLGNTIDFEKDFYYIEMNDIVSFKKGKKAIILTGFSPAEIKTMAQGMLKDCEQRFHQNTGIYIMEKK